LKQENERRQQFFPGHEEKPEAQAKEMPDQPDRSPGLLTRGHLPD
jgi:hypothetical protein